MSENNNLLISQAELNTIVWSQFSQLQIGQTSFISIDKDGNNIVTEKEFDTAVEELRAHFKEANLPENIRQSHESIISFVGEIVKRDDEVKKDGIQNLPAAHKDQKAQNDYIGDEVVTLADMAIKSLRENLDEVGTKHNLRNREEREAEENKSKAPIINDASANPTEIASEKFASAKSAGTLLL